MTLEKLFDGLVFNQVSSKDAVKILGEPNHRKTINYFLHHDAISKEPLKDHELTQLNSLVNILQIIHNSEYNSPLSDSDYETLHEMLIDSGIPRISSDIEINDLKKRGHTFQQLRGTLKKIHYLTADEIRTNPSRKYLDDWVKSSEIKYEKITGTKIDLNECKVILTPKYDGSSATAEVDSKGKVIWLTRGDTDANLASDVTHVLRRFNDLYCGKKDSGIKFEIMVTEENKDYINEFYRDKNYKNSRQVVTAALNSKDIDFKADYLYPVPLRVINKGESVEMFHQDTFTKFPFLECKLGERERIRDFGRANHTVSIPGGTLRTDGVVITIADPKIQMILGRDDNRNDFEVAFKFTEESGYSTVKNIEFYVSDFGYVTPVVVVNDILLKGNTIHHITMSNRERFDELGLCRGDTVKVLYDIIPYVTIDKNCHRSGKPRIPFATRCPSCDAKLNLEPIQVQCHNPECPSRIVGRILNWCTNLRIHDLGYQSLESLYYAGLLKRGIRSLYKLKDKRYEIEDIPGFGTLKAKKIIREIESKRRLNDYEIFGSLGIETLSIKTFQLIFGEIPYQTFMDFIPKEFNELESRLLGIKGIGPERSAVLIQWLKIPENRKELMKLLEQLSVKVSYGGDKPVNGGIAFTGCRPDSLLVTKLIGRGWGIDSAVTKKTAYLVSKDDGYTSGSTDKANSYGIPIISFDYLVSHLNDLKRR